MIMIKATRNLTLIIIFLTLAGCTLVGDGETIEISETVVSQSTLIVGTQTPHATKPAATPLGSTSTPVLPTATKSVQLDLPDWLSDPNIEVFSTVTGNLDSQHFQLVFFNAVTNERYNAPQSLISDAGAYFWHSSGKSFGLVSKDGKTISLIDMVNATVSIHATNPKITEYIRIEDSQGYPPYPVFALGHPSDEEKFTLFENQYFNNRPISLDGQYIASLDRSDYLSVIIEDRAGGHSNRIFFPDNDLFFSRFEWSPKENLLALVRTSRKPGIMYDWDQLPELKYSLAIYDPATNSWISSFPNVAEAIWSPDGKMILYDRQGNVGRYTPYDYDSTPCVLTLKSKTTNCQSFVRQRHGKIQLHDFNWMPSGSEIIYVYETGDNIIESGFCIANITSKGIVCPSEVFSDILKEKRLTILDYSVSPTGNFIIVYIDDSCIGCDYQTRPEILKFETNSGNYQFLDLVPYLGDSGLWRPAITD